MTVSWSFINSVALILITAAVGWYLRWLGTQRDERVKRADKLAEEAEKKADALAEANTALLKRVDDLEKNMTVVNQVAQPLNQMYLAMLVKQLTHLHTPTLDALMAKIGPPSMLTLQEEHEMAALLKERAEALDDQIDESERDAAIMLPMVLKRANRELQEMTINPVELTVVASLITPHEYGEYVAASGTPASGAEAVAEKHQEEGA